MGYEFSGDKKVTFENRTHESVTRAVRQGYVKLKYTEYCRGLNFNLTKVLQPLIFTVGCDT